MTGLRIIIASIASIIGFLLILPLLIFSLPFWFVSCTHNWIYSIIRRFKPVPSSWGDLIEYHPVIGWKPKPKLDTFAKDMAGNSYSLTTDQYGWRNGVIESEEKDVFVFGDSFAFGYGVNDDEFFANVISNPCIRVIGANGYNMVQEYLLMETYAPEIKNKMVIWFIYHGNDLYENLVPNLNRYRMPFLRETSNSEGWEIVTRHVNPARWSITTQREYKQELADICSETLLSKRVFDACDFLIEKGKKTCENQNAKLIIFSLPDVFQMDENKIKELMSRSSNIETFDSEYPDKKLRDICEHHSIPFFTMKDYLTVDDFITNEIHWNKKGNKKVAELIKDIHMNDGVRSRDLYAYR